MRSLFELIPASVVALFVAEIAVISTAFVLAVYWMNPTDASVWLAHDQGRLRVGLMVVCMLIGLYMQDLYSDLRIGSGYLLFQQVCLVIGIAFLLQAMLGWVSPNLVLPRWVMMAGSLPLLIVLPVWRRLFSAALDPAMAAARILLVGGGPITRQIAERIAERPELGMRVIGLVDESEEAEGAASATWLGKISQLKEIATREKPTRIVVGMSERRGQLPIHDLLDLCYSGFEVQDAERTFEMVYSRVCTDQLRPSQIVFSHEMGPKPFLLSLQNFYSRVIALVSLIVLLPLLLLVALLVRITSPGPALYSQRRTGLHGRVFTVYKFRSMRADAEAKTGAVWASKDDPRVTPIGKWLRRLRIDEFPQLFNVLKGEMSIVGPRPERPEFVKTLSEQIPFYRQRLAVRPGVTGWAQINYKYGDTVEDTIRKLEFDLYYIKNLTPALDFYIMLQTVKVMLLTRGAQ